CASLFFFSSRRRHTRFSRHWSSDVCSSDLEINRAAPGQYRQPTPATIIQAYRHHIEHGDRPYFIGWRGNDKRGEQVSPENLAKKIGRASCREREVVAEDAGLEMKREQESRE